MSLPNGFESLSRAEQRAYFESLSQSARLDVAAALAEKLHALVDAWPELILDGLEAKLTACAVSKAEADALLAKVRRA